MIIYYRSNFIPSEYLSEKLPAELLPDTLVTTNTNQTITGLKTLDYNSSSSANLILNSEATYGFAPRIKIANTTVPDTEGLLISNSSQNRQVRLDVNTNKVRLLGQNIDMDLGKTPYEYGMNVGWSGINNIYSVGDIELWAKDANNLPGKIKILSSDNGSTYSAEFGTLGITGSYIKAKSAQLTFTPAGVLRAESGASSPDLGTRSLKWKDLYLSGNLSDGTNTVTIADIAALITYAKGQSWIQ